MGRHGQDVQGIKINAIKFTNSMKEKPAYYAILPASVRYDDRLTASAKILYAEITALSEREGYCWARNKYFAELYGRQETTVSAWISQLKEYGHIEIEGGGQSRKMWPVSDIRKNQKRTFGLNGKNLSEKSEGRTIRINNTSEQEKGTNESDFDFFIKIYPSQVNRQQTEIEWMKLSPEDRAIAVEDLPKRIGSGANMPYAQKYLRTKYWNNPIMDFRKNPKDVLPETYDAKLWAELEAAYNRGGDPGQQEKARDRRAEYAAKLRGNGYAPVYFVDGQGKNLLKQWIIDQGHDEQGMKRVIDQHSGAVRFIMQQLFFK